MRLLWFPLTAIVCEQQKAMKA